MSAEAKKNKTEKVIIHRSQPVAKEIVGLGEKLENGDIVLDFAKLNQYLEDDDDTEPVYTYPNDPGPWVVEAIVPRVYESLFGERRLARAPQRKGFAAFVKSCVRDFIENKHIPDEALLTPIANITETFLRTGKLSINTGDYVALNSYFRRQVAPQR